MTSASDGEMATALADLDRKIAGAGPARVSAVRIQSSKGVCPMTKTFIQTGDMITVSAPVGGITSGDGVIVGSLFGIAAVSAAEGEAVEIATRGVYTLPKDPAAVIALGDRVAWDAAAKQIKPPAVGLYPVGIATETAGNGITTVRVQLDGVATAAYT